MDNNLNHILSKLEDNKALDIVSINLKGKSDIADYLVIATGTSSEKLEKTKDWGANSVVLTHKEDGVSFRKEVKDLTEGKGADVIYDPVGGDVFDESIRCINWGGRLE